jgi:hypothetical protein
LAAEYPEMSKLALRRMRIPMMLLAPYGVPAAWLAGETKYPPLASFLVAAG